MGLKRLRRGRCALVFSLSSRVGPETCRKGCENLARAVIENRARSRIENLPVVFFLNGKKIGANSARTTTFRYVPRQTGKHVFSVRAGPAERIGQRRERSNTAKARLTVNETQFTPSSATSQALMPGHAEPTPGKAAARNKVAVPTVKDGHRIAPVTGEGKRGRSGAQVARTHSIDAIANQGHSLERIAQGEDWPIIRATYIRLQIRPRQW